MYFVIMNDLLPVKKSKIDKRDFIWENYANITKTLPKECNHIDELLPIRDQGSQGTCFAQSAACMKEWQEKKDYGLNDYLSPQFFYNQRDYWNNGAKNGDGVWEDYGMESRDVMRILKNIGICLEKDYPYGIVEKANEIPAKIYESAKKHCIKSYARIDTLEGLKRSLYQNGPCLIAFPIYNYDMEMWKKQDENSTFLGGHAMVVVGYDDKEQQFIIRNSWGTYWGLNGYCFYKYEDWGSHWECWTTIDQKTIFVEEEKEEVVEEEVVDENEYVIIDKEEKKDKDCFDWIKDIVKNFRKN